jgi:TrmH family RNA methyltransferase
MPPITSPHNQKLKEIRKLRMRRRDRERDGRFVAEGEDLLAAADAAGWVPLERFCAAGSNLPGIPVEPQLLAGVSGLASGTRALAVYAEHWLDAPIGPVCVHLHGVHDPGNVGTILRSAAAFGAASVSIGPGTADPFSPKAVRASMGAVFEMPLARAAPLEALPGATIALVTDPAAPELWRVASQRADHAGSETTLIVGAERDGLPPELAAAAEHRARIPIDTHSLNAAMAATVALYEVTRMRRA